MRLHPTYFDLLFCILMIFVAIATLARSPREESSERTLPPVDLPRLDEVASAGVSGRDRVTVSIRREGDTLTYFAEREPADSAGTVVRMLRETATAREVVIRADADVPYGVVLGIVADLSRGGFDAALAYEDTSRNGVRIE